MELAGQRPLDHGHAFAVRVDGHPGFGVEIDACAAPGCTCTVVALTLYPRDARFTDETPDVDAEVVSVRYDVRNREIRDVLDPGAWLVAPVDEAWLRSELAGATGDRLLARFDRLRASRDRRTWQAFAWDVRKRGDMVAHHELFPHDWDLLVSIDTCAAWAIDTYCVEPSCSCQDLVVSFQSFDGKVIGDATLRLRGERGVAVVRADRDATAHATALVEQESPELRRRFAEMRRVARRLKTWARDLADPASTIETLLGKRAELDIDDIERARALGERVVAALVGALQDVTSPDTRRRRAARLLAATGAPTAVDALSTAITWAAPEVDPDLFDDLVNALCEIREPSLEALLAVLPTAATEPERERVVFALADLRIADPRVLALIAEHIPRDPGRWTHFLEWQGVAAIPVARATLTAALDAQPPHLDDAREAIDVLERLGAEVENEERIRIERAEAASAEAAVERRARAVAEAEAARAELAVFDRTVRPGRNQPCWCGSGSKYKKCHLAADETTRGALVRRTLGHASP